MDLDSGASDDEETLKKKRKLRKKREEQERRELEKEKLRDLWEIIWENVSKYIPSHMHILCTYFLNHFLCSQQETEYNAWLVRNGQSDPPLPWDIMLRNIFSKDQLPALYDKYTRTHRHTGELRTAWILYQQALQGDLRLDADDMSARRKHMRYVCQNLTVINMVQW